MRIRMFGELEVTLPSGKTVTRFRTQKAASLLAFLAYHPDKAHSRETLACLLWPESDDENAKMSLRQELSSLRRHLETGSANSPVFTSDRTSVTWHSVGTISDKDIFETAITHIATGDGPAVTAACERIVETYRGALLPRVYEDWVVPERERCTNAWCDACLRLSASARTVNETRRAIELLHNVCAAEPFHEEAHIRLALQYSRDGRADAGLACFESCSKRLKAELNLNPSPAWDPVLRELRTPHAKLGFEIPASAPIGNSNQADIGQFVVPVHARLPRPNTVFFGRDSELHTLCKWLDPTSQNEPMVVTLTGQGGAGKTRLALSVAQKVTDLYFGRVLFVGLSGMSPGESVLSRIANAFPERDRFADPDVRIGTAIGNTPTLLVIDNLEEHTAEAASVIESLLEVSPGLHIIATSRLPLGLAGEQEFAVGPLPLPMCPPGEHVLALPVVGLFVDRVQAIHPEFRLTERNAADVCEICRSLEGIPLAIELAARWSRVLTPAQILSRLDDRLNFLVSTSGRLPDRHRSLRAALEGSYHLLTDSAQAAFRALSVFRGGFTTDSALTVVPEARMEDLMELSRHSLVWAGDEETPRLRMLETVRLFAQSISSEDERFAFADRHATYFTVIAGDIESKSVTPQQVEATREFEREGDNLRAALRHAVDSGNHQQALRITVSLRRLWSLKGQLREGLRWMNEVISASENDEPTVLLAKAYLGAGIFRRMTGDLEGAERHYARTIEIAKTMGDHQTEASALAYLGVVARVRGDLDRAFRLQEMALELRRDFGDDTEIGGSLNNLGIVARETGNLDRARELLLESLIYFERAGAPAGLATAFINLGTVDLRQDKLSEARESFLTAAGLLTELDDRGGIAECIEGLATIISVVDPQQSCRLWGSAERLREEIALPIPQADRDRHSAAVEAAKTRIGATLFDSGWREGRALTWEDALKEARDSN